MAYRHVHEEVVDLSQARLFEAIADVEHWPSWDSEIAVALDTEPLVAGSRFFLTPKGGQRVTMLVETIERPRLFVDVALLPLGLMRTSHRFEPVEGGTRLQVVIETHGLLGWFWDRVIARKQAADLAAQTARFVAHARLTP